jgi:alkylation response protein AidB-like acyl-CoA dehydrogenase
MTMLAKTNSIAAIADWAERARRIGEAIADHADRHDREDSFVEEGFALLKQEGFMTALVPEEFGGGGASFADICEAIRVLAQSCGSTALAYSMHCHLVAVAAWRAKHQAAPTEGLLRRVAAENLWLVSTGGNDWLSSGGSAERVEGGFRITARKPFASGCNAGDLLNTSALYTDPGAGPTVLHFGVSLKAEGVRIEESWQTMGMRGTGSNDVVLEQVFVPEAGVAGRRPAGEWHMLFHVISKIAFAFIYSAYLGVAESARDIAIASAGPRQPAAVPAQLAGEMENHLLMARLAHAEAVRIAQDAEPGPETTSAAMQCRQLIGQNAIAAVERALELAGGSAFYRRHALERRFRDIQAARFHPLQAKPQLDLTGRVALGWPLDG